MPPVPDPEGFASPFAGVAGNALLVAGGAHFPDLRPWEGGTKVWSDRIFLLAEADGEWTEIGRLSRPNAYGLSANTPGGVLCVGGGDAHRHFDEVFQLVWNGRQLSRTALPALPRPCAFMSGAVAGDWLYVAGGIDRPDATEALATFWALDLTAMDRGWRNLPPCPGPARMLAVAGADADTFYLFSGVSLRPDAQGKAVRTYLRDAHAYREGSGWRRLADVPVPCVAAPSPAPLTPAGEILVIGGDDGTRVHLNGPGHPGFPREILRYEPAKDQWSPVGAAPFSRATVPTTPWRGRWVIANGERIPGYRTPEVWTLECQPNQ